MLKVFHERELRTLLIAACAAALAIGSLCGLLYVRTVQNKALRDHSEYLTEQVYENCKSIEDIKTRIRDSFMEAKQRLSENTDLSVAQRTAAELRYDIEIARFSPDQCPLP